MRVVVDASVFVAAARTSECNHLASIAFFRTAISQATHLIIPTLCLPECAAAIARATGNAKAAAELVAVITSNPLVRVDPITVALASHAAELAIQCRLRGADAIYAALARQQHCPLITWDNELLERCVGFLPVHTPDDLSSVR